MLPEGMKGLGAHRVHHLQGDHHLQGMTEMIDSTTGMKTQQVTWILELRGIE